MNEFLADLKVSVALIGLFLVWPRTASAGDQAERSRYRFKVGQELNYAVESKFKFEGGSHGTKNEFTIWVVRKNDDGSHRIVIRDKSTFRLDRTQGQGHEQTSVNVGYADMFDDGRAVSEKGLGYQLDPSALFPRLPKNETEVREGWESYGRYDSRMRLTSDPNAISSTAFVFNGVSTSPTDKIYVSSRKTTFHFDRQRGFVVRAESEFAQGYGVNGKGTGTTELKSIDTHDTAWAKSFAASAERYINASDTYEALTTQAAREKEVDALLAKAESALEAARDAIDQPDFRKQLEDQIKQHRSMLGYYKQGANDRAAILGKPAAEWDIKDLDGKTHTLKDYRGKVVLLDFWYRGCGWCIRAMPQVKELAEAFKGKPVQILGMNTDRDEADARLVIDAMKLNYPTLKATGVPEKYKVTGFPTLIIIDQAGNVADIHIGYSPTLRDEVATSVNKLLEKH
jgi:thiol-disulfide isomerase/thioredoxin